MSTPQEARSTPLFASALSTREQTEHAVEEVCASALDALGGAVPDLAVCFFSGDHVGLSDPLAARLVSRLGTENVLACSAESVAGVGREIEIDSAVSLWVACLPGTNLVPMHLQYERSPEGGSFSGWPETLPDPWPVTPGPDGAALLVLGDPFSFPADLLLELVNDGHPGLPVVGGMASAGHQPGENRLILGRQVFDQGAVALLIDGGIRIETVVSQGCRPIGDPFVITRAERNVIYELGGLPAYRRLVEVFQTLPTREQQLVQRGLHVGRVVSEYRDHFEHGDFLIRNVVGVDANAGAIAIADYVRPGQTVQFHVRDAETADADLRQTLAARPHGATPRGALLFTCNGRGTRLFPEPHHDAGVVGEMLGRIPLAGFFAAGELGPVAGHNFLHGFTASVVLFSPLD